MTGGIFVLLPASLASLADVVREAGATPVIDATGPAAPAVPDGAWVRTRPGRPAPGTGPVILAELGAPVPDRPTWLESAAPRATPKGYAGIVLKGREAGGLAGEEDGLVALAQCENPGEVLLDAGVGPDTAAAAAALGARGVMLVEPWLGCPEVGLPAGLAARLDRSDSELTQRIAGVRVANSPTAPVLRDLAKGGDVWSLATGVFEHGPRERLWLAGQGLALATELAQRYGSLRALLAAYVDAFQRWPERARRNAEACLASPVQDGRTVHSATALAASGTIAGVGPAETGPQTSGIVGSAVLWQEAAFLRRPVHPGSNTLLLAALASGRPVVADPSAIQAVLDGLPAPQVPVAPRPPGTPTVDAASAARTATAEPEARAAIAIIGIGCLLPGGANSPEAFWDNIVSERSAIGPVPDDRWDPDLYFDADKSAPDRTYTTIGGFLEGFEFQSKRFRIPPRVAGQVDPVQQITLTAVADALQDANLQVDKRDKTGRAFDRARCAVILGNSLGGEVSDQYAVRLAWPAVEQQLQNAPSFQGLTAGEKQGVMAELEQRFKADLPEINEDSMPGELANVIAGRIANAFDLGGANYTVDAACASSMAAIDNACKALQNGDADLCITGGSDRSMNIATYVKFCKIGALSPDHSAPFDASANGFVMGEGAGILVLKRYEEAVADGDRIYAVIRGIGASSDGKGKGITAPNIIGQIRALERAYKNAGLQPIDVDLVEAHGTSTVVGDKVEVEALTEVIGSGKRTERGPIRIGSVKSMIGHLKSAAGAASCIKAALALHHGVLPPSLGFQNARPELPLDTVPLQVQSHAEPWPETPDGIRRAGVSAFGFGGTNFHVVMESYGGQPLPKSRASGPPAKQVVSPSARPAPFTPPPAAPVAPVAVAPAPVVTPPDLPEGIWATSGADTAELLANLEALAAGRPAPFEPSSPLRIAAASMDAEERESQLQRAIKTVRKGSNPDMLRGRGVHLEDGPIDGKLALLFTGQGSQYTDMGLDLAEAYPLVKQTFEEADRIVAPTLGKGITDFIRCGPDDDREAKEEVLKRTEYSQPATLTLDVAILRLLASYGVQPDMVAGHSLGEYGAAVAAGILTFEQALLAVSARGREMANIRLDDPGKMAGIATNTETVEEVLAEVQGYVVAANKNCPSQTVIAGASDAVDEAVERFRARGITVHPLPVSHAFHSRIVAPASEPLRGVLEKLGPTAPRRPITTNVTGDWYPESTSEIVDILAQQISSPVEWVAQTERMYASGARLFVECGPKRALAGFTVAILKRRPHRAMYTNHPKRGGVRSFRDSLAGLVAAGFPVRSEPATGPDADLFAPAEPRRSTTEAIASAAARGDVATEVPADIEASIVQIVADATGYEPEELDLDYELEADLGVDTVKQAEVFGLIRETFQIPEDPDFDPGNHKTLRSLIDWAGSRIGAAAYRQAPAAPAIADEPTEHAPLTVPTTGRPVGRPVNTTPSSAAPAIGDDALVAFLQSAASAGMSNTGAEAFAKALLPAVQNLLSAAIDARSAIQPAPPTPVVERAAVQGGAVSVVQHGPASGPTGLPDVVCSGASLGLPGGDGVFDPMNLVSILRGDNRIDHIGDRAEKFLEKGIVRLVKDAQTGAGSFLPVETLDQVIRLAGVRHGFDLSDWGTDARLVRALDITSQLAIAAGLEALRDAGIPLVRSYKTSKGGKRVPGPWLLPEALRDGTGVIFASAFPGYDELIRKVQANGDDGEGRFDRRFLFQVLAMGHSQFAQLIGARGPNTAVNAACASTTQALTIAEDWIRLGRAERVLVIGADDVTSPDLLPWIGSGFMAAGAATTEDRVENAALPFDARRHGMILGMGAVGMVVERQDIAHARGIVPIATLVASHVVNSAFHGSRLDVTHIAGAMKGLVARAATQEGVAAAEIAKNGFFMSHETYTPARGGSAAAEIDSLRAAFGDAANQMTIANTKGFTGHPMGAGIEDTVAVKALQYGIVPPLANLQQPDPDLGDLRLSRGEHRDFRYALRLAAGFGSQLALTLWRREARGDSRVADPARRLAWLKELTGFDAVEEHIEQRTLRVRPGALDHQLPIRPRYSPADLLTGDGSDAPVSTGASAGEWSETPVGTAALKDRAAKVLPPPGAVKPDLAAAVADAARGTAAPSRDQVLQELVAIIAEKTGYEPDELEVDFELEADLGIDTVKQAEVLGDITDRYGLSQDEDFRLSDHPTIEALASYVSDQIAATPGPSVAADQVETQLDVRPEPAPDAPAALEPPETFEPPPPAPAASEASAGGADRESILAKLVAVVAEKTGYDEDELETDFELEADLGIDTVKQAEILGDLREHLGFEQDEDFRLADHPTIEALADYLAEQVSKTGFEERPDITENPTQKAPEPERPPLSVIDPVYRPGDVDPTLEPLPSDTTPVPAPSRDDVFPDDLDRHALSSSSTRVRIAGVVPLPESFRVRRPILVDRPATPKSTSLDGMRVLVVGESSTATAVRQEVGHRGGLTEAPYDAVVDVSEQVLDAFRQARFLEQHRPKRWLTVTRLGGLDPQDGDRAWRDGARAGFTKALGREWDETRATVLDMVPTDGDLEIASAVCDELRIDGDTEVHLRDGRRQVVRYKTENRPASNKLFGEPLFLITGGARGICARIALEFAQRGRVRLVLVGRSAVPDTAWDLRAEKARVKELLQGRGERPTPANIEKHLAPMRKANEAWETIDGLRKAGAEVFYETCDLADPDATKAMVQSIQNQFGPVDVCIHGAGVEESRLIAEKDEIAWHRVFDGKAIGGRALMDALSDSTVFVSMGSVAGRFGNPGQVDYAAANDALARRCLAHPNALHIDWTAWDDVGMASDSAMKRILNERGVDLLPADAGAALLADLVAAEFRGELVVAGRLGDFQTDPGHPLLDRIEMDGDVVRGYREMSLQSDGWIRDHAIEGTPVLPGVIGLELMAAVASLVQPGAPYVGARDVKFEAPVKIHGDQTVLLVIEAEPEGPGEVRARLIAVRALRTGRIRRQEHFSAIIQLGLSPEVDPLPNAFLPDEVIERDAIYQRFFHGPIFQVLTTVFGVSADGLIAEASVNSERIAATLLTGPLALEAAFQSAGLHGMVTAHVMGLPMAIERVQYIQPPHADQTFSVTVRQRGSVYDVDVDALNTPLLRIRGFAMAEAGPIKPDDRFPEPSDDRPRAFPVGTSKRGGGATGARAHAGEDPSPWLTEEEVALLTARGTHKRQRDRIAGRIAAKRALAGLTGVDPLDMRVHTAESGAPVAEVPGWPDVQVSLSHREGRAVAVAVPRGRVGVDLERVEARPVSFADTWLSARERLLVRGPLQETLIWSTKEAVLKALGTGMAIAPHHVQVTAIGSSTISVSLDGPAEERLKLLGERGISVAWSAEGEEEVLVRVDLAA